MIAPTSGCMSHNHHSPNKPLNFNHMKANVLTFLAGQPVSDLYMLVKWPFVQDLMEYDWFRPECRLHHAFDDQEYLSSAYFVPLKRLLELQHTKIDNPDVIDETVVERSTAYQVNSAINVCNGRIENGTNISEAFSWLQEEVDQIFDGKTVY